MFFRSHDWDNFQELHIKHGMLSHSSPMVTEHFQVHLSSMDSSWSWYSVNILWSFKLEPMLGKISWSRLLLSMPYLQKEIFHYFCSSPWLFFHIHAILNLFLCASKSKTYKLLAIFSLQFVFTCNTKYRYIMHKN